MFTDAINGLQHIKRPLLAGYSLLLSFWIARGAWLRARWDGLEDDSPAELVDTAFDTLGSAATLAIVSLLAFVVGSIADRVFLSPILAFVERRFARRSMRSTYDEGRLGFSYKETLNGQRDLMTDEVVLLVPRATNHRGLLERYIDERSNRFYMALATLPICLAAIYTGANNSTATLLVPVGLVVAGLLVGIVELVRALRDTEEILYDADALWSSNVIHIWATRLLNHPLYGARQLDACSPHSAALHWNERQQDALARLTALLAEAADGDRMIDRMTLYMIEVHLRECNQMVRRRRPQRSEGAKRVEALLPLIVSLESSPDAIPTVWGRPSVGPRAGESADAPSEQRDPSEEAQPPSLMDGDCCSE